MFLFFWNFGQIRAKANGTETKWLEVKSFDLSRRAMANICVGCSERPSKPQVHAKTHRLSSENCRSSSRSELTALSKGKDDILWPKIAKAQTHVDRLCSSQSSNIDARSAIACEMSSWSVCLPRRARDQRMLAQFWASFIARNTLARAMSGL